jgi:hypothetical protein
MSPHLLSCLIEGVDEFLHGKVCQRRGVRLRVLPRKMTDMERLPLPPCLLNARTTNYRI